jgi:hypothetical protein
MGLYLDMVNNGSPIRAPAPTPTNCAREFQQLFTIGESAESLRNAGAARL